MGLSLQVLQAIKRENERKEREKFDPFDSKPQFEPDVIDRAIAANARGLKG